LIQADDRGPADFVWLDRDSILDGWVLDVWQWKATRTMLKVATGEIGEEELARWIMKHSRPGDDEEELESLESDDEDDADDRHPTGR